MASRRVLVAQMNDRSSVPVKVEPDVEIAVRLAHILFLRTLGKETSLLSKKRSISSRAPVANEKMVNDAGEKIWDDIRAHMDAAKKRKRKNSVGAQNTNED